LRARKLLVEPLDVCGIGNDCLTLGAREFDPFQAKLLLGLELRNDDGALRLALTGKFDLLLQEFDLILLTFNRLQRSRTRLLAMQTGVSAAQGIDNSSERCLGITLGERLRNEERPKRLLDLHLLVRLLG
jgi:hypothetical protein